MAVRITHNWTHPDDGTFTNAAGDKVITSVAAGYAAGDVTYFDQFWSNVQGYDSGSKTDWLNISNNTASSYDFTLETVLIEHTGQSKTETTIVTDSVTGLGGGNSTSLVVSGGKNAATGRYVYGLFGDISFELRVVTSCPDWSIDSTYGDEVDIDADLGTREIVQ